MGLLFLRSYVTNEICVSNFPLDGILLCLTNTIVFVPSILLSMGRYFPIPCVSLPNSFVRDPVHVTLSSPFNNRYIDCKAPVFE